MRARSLSWESRTKGCGAIGVSFLLAGAIAGCGDRPLGASGDEARLSALMADGDVASITGVAPAPLPPPATAPPRPCVGDACTSTPLAFWSFDDCTTSSTQLADTGGGAFIQHPAFRAVSVACTAGIDAQAVQMAGADDVVYAPDQPDFIFDAGVTIAAWIKPDRVTGTQTIVRKRLDGTSSFLLAIDDKRLVFVVQLKSGRATAVSAPLDAGRFTHVAATYDGKQAALYLNGTAAAQARAAGTLAAGAGPIFVGNDANGRRFRGVIDSLWLNTLAAPAATVAALTCIRQPPVASLSPAESPATPGGIPVPFDLAVSNPSSASCPTDVLEFAAFPPFPLSADVPFGFLAVAPGQTGHATINITAAPGAPPGPYPFQVFVANTASFALQSSASATFVVAPTPPPSQTGCAAAPTQPVAPGGYYVNGNTVCAADGRAHIFHGVDRPSMEWSHTGVNISRADFQLMGTWNPNVVRIGLNQDFWLSASPLFDPDYAALLDDAVRWAEMAGMDVLLDLHWSDRGVLGGCLPANGCQQLMPDANSATFWSEVAGKYRNDGRVMFELYNEPHENDGGFGNVTWDVWQSGGDTGQGWQAVGMQQLYDTIRATGADNLVFIGGLNWAYDLSGVPAHRIKGHNIVYTTHPYTASDNRGVRAPSDWDRAWGFLTRTDPVVATEFGVLNDTACTTDYDAQVIAYADAHFAGWTAWAWYPGGCLFPAIVNDWAGTPSATGSLVKTALLGYSDPPASPPLPSPGPARAIEFTFATSRQGFGFSDFDAKDITNLAVHVPPGATAPTLRFDATDGDPTSGPGALRQTVGFSGLDQYVDAIVTIGAPGLPLPGKTLHANIKLVSGSIGGLQFHASSGATFVFKGAFFTPDNFPVGQWVPVTLDLGTAPDTNGFDPNQVVQLGVQIFSGFSGPGATFTPSGPTVVEIDTVVD